jgi:hypothetical protein
MDKATRILGCRLGFFVFCLLPTVLVAGWIVRRSRPEFVAAEVAEWQHSLAQQTGLTVTIGSVTYPNYYTARLDALQFADPETGDFVARVRSVEVARSGDAWLVEASQPEVDLPKLRPLLAMLHDRLLRTSAWQAPCELAANELTVHSGELALTLGGLQVRREQTASGSQLACEFRLPEAAANSPASRIAFTRNLHQSPAVTRCELQTAGASLPCNVLGDLLPVLARLGPAARFQGAAWFTTGEEGLSGEVNATLENVDLDGLVTEQYPHELSGLARVQLVPAKMHQGRFVELRGTLQAHDGRISASLVNAAAEHLALQADAAIADLPPASSLPYRQLSLGFHLTEDGLALSGSGDPTRDGVLLASAAGILLQAPPEHRVSPLGLISTLVPDKQLQVPATQQTSLLVKSLPLPSIAPAQTATRPPGHVPTRLAPSRSPDAANTIRER